MPLTCTDGRDKSQGSPSVCAWNQKNFAICIGGFEGTVTDRAFAKPTPSTSGLRSRPAVNWLKRELLRFMPFWCSILAKLKAIHTR